MTLTQERLKHLLEYNPETGEFSWLVDRTHVKRGDKAGAIGSHGRRQLWIDGGFYLASRLAWFWMLGVWPLEIDHRDRNNQNDKWDNLREANRTQNSANRRGWAASGYRGVQKTRNGKWQAQVGAAGRLLTLGTFLTKEEASQAVETKRRELYGEFAGV